MRAKRVIIFAIAAFAASTSVLAAPEFAVPTREPFMRTGAVTSQPIGHHEFCQRNVDECAVKTVPRSRAQVTDAGWAAIREVNTDVNQRIMPMTDAELFGRNEVWTYPSDTGDCEDYVLLKRRELIRRGFSEADLLITVVRKYDGTGHAVLTVRTSEGDFVLDNLSSEVRLWSDTPYHYLKRQSSMHSGRWVEIENCVEDVPVGSIDK
ncbi:MAG: transglutaminase-like cysteine peptidase [Rhizobium sp.]|nr:transglutaminase-like cysteine peptidase [Rhizobium sp.]